MKKRVRQSLLCIISMFLFCMGNGYMAMAAPVTKVGTVEALLEAVQHCTEGARIVLEKDIRLAETLRVDCDRKTVSLDLAGHRLDIIDRFTNAVAIKGAGTLVIMDSQDTGRLYAECSFTSGASGFDTAGIRVDSAQALVIDGAEVVAKGGAMGAGIGSGLQPTGTIIIKSGTVTAAGGNYGAGIGGGFNRYAGSIVIEGGRVTGTGGQFGAGIGTGGFTRPAAAIRSNQVTVRGGIVTAIGGVNASGIGGGQCQASPEITVMDGTIDARGGASGAGIGSGYLNLSGDEVEAALSSGILFSGDIKISGGNIKSGGGKAAAGIGTGEGASDYAAELALGERRIKISGGNICAYGGQGGAGIGGGTYFSGGMVEINPAMDTPLWVEASGGGYGAGIGGGKAGVAGMLAIHGGVVTARGGANAPGIGTGGFTREHVQPTGTYFSDYKNARITGGRISAHGGSDAAAIGGGAGGAGIALSISGMPVVEAVSQYENSIGAGRYSIDQGSLAVNGGNIRVNKTIGPQPTGTANGRCVPVYQALLSVITEDEKSPVAGAIVNVIADDAYTYAALTDEHGTAAMYLPADTVGISVVPSGGGSQWQRLGKMAVTADHQGSMMLEVPNNEPLKIISESHTYYPGDNNTFQLAYTGGLNETAYFSISGDSNGVSVDKKTGLLTIPVQIRPGTHVFTVHAANGAAITDSVRFTLHVESALASIELGPRDIITELDREHLIHIKPEPPTAKIAYSDWAVLYGLEGTYTVKGFTDEAGEKYLRFIGDKPGNVSLMVAAQDAKGNKAWETLHISVVDPTVTVFSDTIGQSLGGAAAVDGITAWSVDGITAWSVDRSGPETAELAFDYDGVATAAYKLVQKGRPFNVAEPGTTAGNGTFQMQKGRNTLTLKDLKEAVSYDCYIMETGASGAEEVVGKILIPPFSAKDILPPVLTDIQTARHDRSTASVTFTSNEKGRYSYFFAEQPGTDANISSFVPLLDGRNKITLTDLQSAEPYAVKLIAEDGHGNWGELLTVDIPAYLPAGSVNPALTWGWSARISVNTAKIGFHAATEGECTYTFVRAGVDAAGLDGMAYHARVAAGDNEVLVGELPDGNAYDIYISVRDIKSGTESAVLKIPTEAYTEKRTDTCLLEAGSIERVGNGLAVITFVSDSEGEYSYSFAPIGSPPTIHLDKRAHEMAEGENTVSLTGLSGESGYMLRIMGRAVSGAVSNLLQMEIEGGEGEERQEVVFI